MESYSTDCIGNAFFESNEFNITIGVLPIRKQGQDQPQCRSLRVGIVVGKGQSSVPSLAIYLHVVSRHFIELAKWPVLIESDESSDMGPRDSLCILGAMNCRPVGWFLSSMV